jgi:hypothetical protein
MSVPEGGVGEKGKSCDMENLAKFAIKISKN